MKLITFSIAAYNVQNYLAELLDSIVDVNRPDQIETLIVNDGSSDSTLDIALKYEQKYPNFIKVINKKNGGYGSTINEGLKHAKGTYFKVLDGDDWIDSKQTRDFIDRLLLDKECDLILTNCRDVIYSETGELIREYVEKYDNLQNGKTYHINDICKLIEWTRFHKIFYNSRLLKENKIFIDENCFYTDAEYTILPMAFVNTIRWYDYTIYNYRIYGEGQSVSYKSRMKNIGNAKTVSNRLLEFYNVEKNNLEEGKLRFIEYGVAMSCCWYECGLLLFSPDKNRKQELINFNKKVKKNYKSIYKLMPKINGGNKMINLIRLTHYFVFDIYGIKNKKRK